MSPAVENRKFSLPFFITMANKNAVGAFLFAMAALLYFPSNHIHLFPPQLLPMTWTDRNTPFLPLTVWVYLSEWVFFGVVYLSCTRLLNLNKYFYSFLTLQVVSNLVFWLWPTTYPRALYPLPVDLDPLTNFMFNFMRQSDSPANCCPSLHVSSVYLSSFLFWDGERKKFWPFFIWANLIALSTLTTKQHYLIDVVTGLALAMIMYLIFHRLMGYRSQRAPVALGDQANR